MASEHTTSYVPSFFFLFICLLSTPHSHTNTDIALAHKSGALRVCTLTVK